MNEKPSFRYLAAMLSLAGFLFFSASASAQWLQVFGPTGGDVEALASDAAGHIYAGTDTGVYFSNDNGWHWTLKDSGLLDSEIFSLAITPGGMVLAGTEGGGIFRSTDSGDMWEASNSGLPDGSNILSLASDRNGNIFAGHSTEGVFYSSDDGTHWIARNAGMESQIIFSLAIAPIGTIYAGAGSYIFSSTDSGQHWDTSLTLPGGDEVLALAADSSGDVFAGTLDRFRYRLLAGSGTWENISPNFSSSDFQVHALATFGSSVFLGLFGAGVWQSQDFGSNWTNISNSDLADPKIYSLTVTPSGNLFAGTYLGDIFRISGPLSVAENGASDASLSAWPQPFPGRVTISFSLEKTEVAKLELFDAMGREVLATPDAMMMAGRHDRTFDLPALPSGAYLFLLRTPSGIRMLRADCLR